MSAPDFPISGPRGGNDGAQRWRNRSRMIRTLRLALPIGIGLIFLGLAGAIAYNTFASAPAPAVDSDEPIRLMNPRFVGRDEKGRAFVLTAVSAIRDTKDYQRVALDRPSLVLDEGSPDEMRIGSQSGTYHEGERKLDLTGGVRLSGVRATFKTEGSQFDTKTGELAGSGAIQGVGSLGEITAKSYAIYGKGDRMVFKGGVHGRLGKK